MKNSGIVLEELLIGSHGSPGNLLSTAGVVKNMKNKFMTLKN